MTPREAVRLRGPQHATILWTVMACTLLLLAVQWILLWVAIEGFQAGKRDLLGASTLGSGLCFAAACWLIRHLPQRRVD